PLTALKTYPPVSLSENEDIYFARAFAKLGYSVPTIDQAAHFCFEHGIPRDPMAVHKPACSTSQQCTDILRMIFTPRDYKLHIDLALYGTKTQCVMVTSHVQAMVQEDELLIPTTVFLHGIWRDPDMNQIKTL